jgi:uncharacterized membrane protein
MMSKGRLEAFSDGVIAIIITIMVLEMKVPHGDTLSSLKPLIPVFFSYVLSFTNVAIYWNNHHHMLHAAKHVNGSVLWANIHLLFWLSLFPFVTGWLGENHFAKWPVVFYGVVSLMAGLAYYWLAQCLSAIHGKDSALTMAIGKDRKGIMSVIIYAAGIAISFIVPWLGFSLYILVAVMWFIPDKRIEKAMANNPKEIEH